MTSQDDLTLLKQMYQRGEISDEQYDVLRRHVLWGTPLPQLIDEIPPAPGSTPDQAGYGRGDVGADRRGDRGDYGGGEVGADRRGDRGAYGGGDRGAAAAVRGRRARREARDEDASDFSPSAYLPPAESGSGRARTDRSSTRPALPGSRQARREAAEAAEYAPSTYTTPAGHQPPRAAPPGDPYPGRATRPPDPDTPWSAGPRPTRTPHREAPDRDWSGAGSAAAAHGDGPGGGWSGAGSAAAPDLDIPASQRSRRGRSDPDASEPDASRGSRRRRRAAVQDDEAPQRRHRAAGRTPAEPARRQGATVADTTEVRRPVRTRRRRSVVAVLTSVVLALALAAAGVYWFALRADGVLPADYARSVCGGVRDWQGEVDSRSSALVGSVAQQQDRTVVRTSVTAYYADLAARTDRLRATLLGLGVADVSGGKAYADSLAAAVGDQATALRELSTRAARLDPTAAATFQIQLQSLLTGAETAVSAVTAALARPAAGTPPALRTALSDEPSCAPYVG